MKGRTRGLQWYRICHWVKTELDKMLFVFFSNTACTWNCKVRKSVYRSVELSYYHWYYSEKSDSILGLVCNSLLSESFDACRFFKWSVRASWHLYFTFADPKLITNFNSSGFASIIEQIEQTTISSFREISIIKTHYLTLGLFCFWTQTILIGFSDLIA